MSKDFCHLHCHSEYSVLDGMIKLPKLCEHTKKSGMSAIALTDHGNLHGLIEFYKSAKAAGINPVIGVEAYITENEDGLENKDKIKDNYHCILLAKNNVGLKNLIYLTNQANLNNFYYRPRISIQNLQSRNEGLIATTSCLGGIVAKQFSRKEEKKLLFEIDNAKGIKSLEKFATLFNNRLYLEIQDHPEIEHQDIYNKWLIEKAKEMNLPTVITADAHFLTEEDYETHKLVMAQQKKVTLSEYDSDEDGLFYVRDNCIRTIDDMHKSAIKYGVEEAFWNTSKIASQCSVDIKLGSYSSPNFDPTNQPDFIKFKEWRAKKNECHC